MHVTSILDYFNSLFLGCPINSLKSLQLIQNAAPKVLMRFRRRDVASILVSLYGLPVKSRVEY